MEDEVEYNGASFNGPYNYFGAGGPGTSSSSAFGLGLVSESFYRNDYNNL